MFVFAAVTSLLLASGGDAHRGANDESRATPVVHAVSAPAAATDASALEADVQRLFREWCTACHEGGDPSEPDGLDLAGALSPMIGRKAVEVDMPLVAPGDPEGSYLYVKLVGGPQMKGDVMPLGDDPLSPEAIAPVRAWILALGDGAAPAPAPVTATTDGAVAPAPAPAAAEVVMTQGAAVPRGKDPFHGTFQSVLPTTATLGQRTLEFRIHHRFGRIGTERGAFGLDAGAIMSLGLAYGIFDGWDVLLRRTNSRKGWELGTKYVPVRQEAGMPLSVGLYGSFEWLRDFEDNVANPFAGNLMVLVSRLWFERWSTQLSAGYHFRTNHNPRVVVDLGEGPVAVEDTRDTLTLGLASTVWLGKKRRWGLDLEYFLPVPDGGSPNVFYYRGGDAGPDDLTQIGAWTLGGSYKIGKHFFQVFFTNQREIHTNLAAPGGASDNPFDTPGVSGGNPLFESNFFLGFHIARKFSL